MRFLMSLFGRLLLGFAGLFDALFRGLRDGLFGVRMPPVLDVDHADAVADQLVAQADVIDERDVRALEAQVAAARALRAAPAPAPAPVVQPPEPEPDPEPETWYRVVAPNGKTMSYACGTAADAEDYWNIGGDGYHVEPVTDAGLKLNLTLLASLEGATVHGVGLTTLADEVADWRSERFFGN